MKITHIITSLTTGGAEKLIVDSLPKYAEKVEVDLIVLKNLGNQSIFKNKLEKEFKGKITYLTKGALYNPLLIFKIGRLLGKYDLAHIHLFPTLYWAVLAKLFFFSKIKLVFTEHNTTNKRRDKILFKPIEKFIYSKLDLIGCITAATKNNLMHHLANDGIKMKVISNGIDLDTFNTKYIKSIDYSFFDEDSFVLIQVASFSLQKDQDTIVHALVLLPSKFKLLLVGDGKRKKEVEELVNKLDLKERVMFLGNRIDVPNLLNYADVNLLSSHFEGFGLTVVEGMAMSKPSIASDVDGVREIIDGYGLLFKKGDEKKLASLLLKLESDTEFYKIIADKCYNRAKEYDITKMVDSYIDEYKKLI